jgi:hypothetical protein
MKGVAFSVSADLRIFDITHDIPVFDIWAAAYRLNQAAAYWPKGTVFVSVVDPGVGSDRKSVVLKTKSGHFIVSPDNGTLTLIAESMGVEAVREIDETRNRLKDSEKSYTFHGRDVYAYIGARLAAGLISFEDVGPPLKQDVIRIPYPRPSIQRGKITGGIPVLDIQYGNIWTNIDDRTLLQLGVTPGDMVDIKIYHNQDLVFDQQVPFGRTFADVAAGMEIAYLNSLLNFSLGINGGNFAERYHIQSGVDWTIVISTDRR